MQNLVKTGGSFNFSYNVELCQHIFNVDNDTIKSYTKDKKLLVIVSKTIKRLYYNQIHEYFRSNTETENSFKIIEISTGEVNKNLLTVHQILREAKEFQLARDSIMVAIGGGILMDMVGMAASLYRRRIRYLRIPTTLLGQIDAGVGIKTGVNFEQSKNFIGSFYPPIACINSSDLLETLPLIELQNGLSEIVKMAIIVDYKLFVLLEEHAHKILNGKCHGEEVNKICYLAIKTMIDELSVNFYEGNLKRLVDYGHSFSPFIEIQSNYEISHGFAVALDMAISIEIAYLLKKITLRQRNRMLKLILKIGLKIYDEQTFLVEPILKSLNNVVLHRGGNLNLVIPTGIGIASFIENPATINSQILLTAFRNLHKFQRDFKNKEFNLVINNAEEHISHYVKAI